MSKPEKPAFSLTSKLEPSFEVLPRRFGKYTLLRRLATGGMAELYLALQRSVAGFEKLIVIKRILSAMNKNHEFIEMLLHEARVAATLSHPNIVQTIDVGQVDGAYFIALEHVHGEDLRSIVRQMRRNGVEEFPLEHAFAIILGVCAGLSYAHERRDFDGNPLKIVHRDISPQNILVGFAGDVKIVDFGVAKSEVQSRNDTKHGQLKGKTPYMSPEQARGEEVDWRSDIFAVGVLLFELTTGRRLFKAKSDYETLKLILECEYPRPSEVIPGFSPELATIIMRALEKDPAQRYQSAREMQSDLEIFIRHEKVPVSSIALAEFMHSLFEEKLAAQQEGLQEGRQLAEILAAEAGLHEGTHTGLDATLSTLATNASQSIGPASSTAHSIVPSRSNSKWAWLALPTAAFVAVFAVYISRTKKDPVVSTPQPSVSSPRVEPIKSKSRLALTTVPPQAHISINGEMRPEVTPVTIENLPEGRIDLKVTLDGYIPKTESIDLKAGTLINHSIVLTKNIVQVSLKTTPTEASVVVDTKVQTTRQFEISASEPHEIVVSAPNYQTKTIKFSGQPGETKSLSITLEKEEKTLTQSATNSPNTSTIPQASNRKGKLMVSASGGWCTASVDGQSHGATPTGSIEVSVGSHSITCTDSNGNTQNRTVQVRENETTRVKFSIE